MLRRLIGASLLVAAILTLPSLSEGRAPDKKKGQAVDPKPATDSAKLTSGEFAGTLKSAPGSDRTFILTTSTKRLEPTGKGGANKGNNALNRVLQAQNHLQQAQMRVATARTPQQARQHQQQVAHAQIQLQQAMAALNLTGAGAGGIPPGYKLTEVKQDIEFQASEECKVRTLVLPETFDDKGNVKKYTKEELAELKGKDKNLIGYESGMDKLEPGAKIKVTLAPVKKPAADAKEKDGDKDKDKDKDPDGDKKMQVKLIVITEEAPQTTTPEKGKKKAK